MTPRQIAAYMILSDNRIRIEKATELNMNAMASRANPKAIGKITKSLLKDR